jgi:hypothetical protein
MTTFQLDECLNSKKLALGCAQEGLCKVFRFPSEMKGLKDPEMLNSLLPKGNPLITTDFALLNEHLNAIPDSHPGIILIANSKSVPETLTIKKVQAILKKFKTQFSQWHQVSWQNSIVCITQDSINVLHIEGGHIKDDGYFTYQSLDWDKKLEDTLCKNAKRTAISCFKTQ